MRQRGSIKMIGLVSLVVAAVATTTGGTAAHAALPTGGALPARLSTVVPAADESDTVGSWTVTSINGDSYELAWTSPVPIPLTDARPEFFAGGQPLGPPALSADGRSLTLQVSSATEPRPVDLDVVLSGRALDEATQPASAPDVSYVAPAGVEPLPDDPGVPGSHPIESDDYRLDATKIAGMPDRVEMLGHVVQPTDADATSPLVLFLHGRHSYCYRPGTPLAATRVVQQGDWSCGPRQSPIPSHLGYDYVQRRLATQGYVTVSISANAINAQDFRLADGGAAARASLVKRHLEQWTAWVGAGRYDVDLDNVILVGHSRGGEGVNRASIANSLAAPYRITGQVLVGPTDFGFQTAPYIPTVTLLPYCDGDVSDLQGQTFTDAARDMTTDDTALHSSALVMGANHNFFNTEWTPGISAAPSFDDWFGDKSKTCGTASDMRLSKAGQRKVGRTYIAGAVHLFAQGDTDVLPMFDGSAVSVASAGNADVRTHLIGGGRELRRPGSDSTVAALAGNAVTRLCIGRANERKTSRVCDPGTSSGRTPHWPASYLIGAPTRRAFEMTWSSPGQQGGLRFDEPLDLSEAASLDLRIIVDPDLGGVRLGLRLHDVDSSVVVAPEAQGRLRALPGEGGSLAKRWAQTLRVPLDGPSNIDLSAVIGFDLVGETEDGRVWVLDAAAVPVSGLAPAPVKRLPALSVRSVSQDEGDGPGAKRIRVPYSITTPTTTESHVVAVTHDAFTGEASRQQLTIPSGTSAGAFSISYQPDTRDDLDRQVFQLSVFSVDGLTTNRYLANAVIRDDDPHPRITLKALPARITEGEVARWEVSLSEPVDYFFTVLARPVEGGSSVRSLTVGDLTPRYRKRAFFPVPPLDRPLTKTRLRLYTSMQPGKKSALVGLPTLADRRPEGRRGVTLRFRSWELRDFERLVTVTVRDPR